MHIQAKLGQENLLRRVRWVRWHCPTDTGFEIQALEVWGRARCLSVTEAPHNTEFHEWMGKKHSCFFRTAENGKRTPNSSVKGSGANHYPRAPRRRLNQPNPLLFDNINSANHRCKCIRINLDKYNCQVFTPAQQTQNICITFVQCWAVVVENCFWRG